MNHQYVKDTLYRLRHDYGKRASLYKMTVSAPNLQTGQKSTVRTRYKVRRMIILPITIQNKFEYDLSFIAANKNFTLGGFFEAGDRIVIIDAKDLPANHLLTMNHYIYTENRWYSVHKFESLLYEFGWMIHARQTQQASVPIQTISATVSQSLGTTSTGTGEIA